MKTNPAHVLLLVAAVVLQSCSNEAYEIYVSTEGNDNANGKSSSPVASLYRAAELARTKAGNVPVTIFLQGGTYTLSEPLELEINDCGSAEAPVQWKAMPGEKPVISGGTVISGWKSCEDTALWCAGLPPGMDKNFRSLYINDRPATRARTPDDHYLHVEKAGSDNRTSFFFGKNDIPVVKKVEGTELVFLHDWSTTRIGVKSIDWEGEHLVTVDSIGARHSFFDITGWEPHPRYYLENALEFCDRPGEWYCDFDERKIYYRPLPGESLNTISAVIPVSSKLVTITGNKGDRAGFIRFEGITFEHTNWQIPDKGYCGIQASMHTDRGKKEGGWSQVPAAIELDHASNCSFTNCTVRNTGGSGIWIRENCRNCTISDSHLYNISANGVNIGEGRDRLVDGIPWWKSTPEEVSRNNRITRSLIESCGIQFYGAIGIWCGLVSNTVIDNNIVRDLPYSGISVGWMWDTIPTPCKENVVNSNHIHHVMNKLHDGGGIYTLGLQPGTRITGNLIHDVLPNENGAESNGMFIDEGSSELLISDNVIFNIGRSPLRFHRAIRDTVSNNVLVCGDDVPPIRYNRTKEASIIKTGNLILHQSSPADLEHLNEITGKRVSEIGLKNLYR